MSCNGCKKARKDFKKKIKNKMLNTKDIEHFMRVCKHGVPNGFNCQSCNKIINIPEDAVIKG